MANQKQSLENLTQENSKKKILIADDTRFYRVSYGIALRKDYDVDYASNVDELLEKTLNEEYSLVLTDNLMGFGYDNSGLYAAEEIRKKDKKIPIILNTSELTDKVKEKARELGINKVLEKPLDLLELREIIKDYVENTGESK